MNGINLTLNGVDFSKLERDVEKIKFLLQDLKQPEKEEELLPFDDGCKMLHITRVTGWTWSKQGKIKTYKIGNKVFMKRSEIMEVVNQNQTKK